MASKKDKKKGGMISTDAVVAVNKQARFNYILEDKYEAGLILTGTEVKSLRHGQASIAESYIGPDRDGELALFNMNIPEYQQASPKMQHVPNRTRKMLLHKREINKLLGSVQRGGYSIVPTKLYFDKKGLAKLEIALGKGKKLHDKRETEKKRDWDKQKARVLKDYN
ncbi:MAG: SsrA-binding protein [Micavibrio sp. TMED27]|nr:MAG: SsrA-binding protein [Micavibrio sp. TMED27]|tara:strand:+ start:495 stop:995 length:501 start_codon:yes stop_codon:yes gene_type:complete